MRLGRLIAWLTLALFAGVSSGALAQDSVFVALSSSARAAVSETLYASSATQSATERAIDENSQALRRSIDAMRTQIAAETTRNDQLSQQLSSAQLEYITALERSDRRYAAEIAILRNAAQHIAADAGGAAALDRFNQGDELGALVALDELREARRAGREARLAIESAAEGRGIARLALEARDRGRLASNDVIARYVEVTNLDPGVAHDWLTLSDLMRTSGQVEGARAAAERGIALGDTAERAALYIALGRAYWEMQRSADAHTAFAASLRATETQFRAAPTFAAEREYAAALESMGDILFLQHIEAEALEHYQRSLVIRRRQATAAPDDPGLQRDLAYALARVGDLTPYDTPANSQAHLNYLTESFEVRRRLAADHPNSARLQADLGAAHSRLGDDLLPQGAINRARQHYDAALTIDRRLLADDPHSVVWARHVAVDLEKIGDTQMAASEYAGALRTFREEMQIVQGLARADEENLELQRMVGIVHYKLGIASYHVEGVAASVAQFDQGIAISRRLIDADPASYELRADIHNYLVNLSEFLTFTGDYGRAIALRQDALLHSQELLRLNPHDFPALEKSRSDAFAVQMLQSRTQQR